MQKQVFQSHLFCFLGHDFTANHDVHAGLCRTLGTQPQFLGAVGKERLNCYAQHLCQSGGISEHVAESYQADTYVFFAALTSAISLMETVVSIFMDKLKWNRRPCCLLALAISLLLGLPSSLGYSAWSEVKVLGMQFLDLFDFVSNSVLMPIVAFCTCLFVGFFLSPRAIAEEIELSGRFRGKRLFSVMIRYIAPLCILLILLSSVLNAFGVIKI
jgi:hypothetical protein